MEAVHTLPVVAAIGDAHTLDELDALFVVVLRDREARKATAAAFETRAWALVESLVDASMAAIVRDTDALAAHRARTLDLLKVRVSEKACARLSAHRHNIARSVCVISLAAETVSRSRCASRPSLPSRPNAILPARNAPLTVQQ